MAGPAPHSLSPMPTADQMPMVALLASKDETIAALAAEIAYLRDQLDRRSRELAAERARIDGLQHDALARMPRPTANGSPPAAPPALDNAEPARAPVETVVVGPPAWRRPPAPKPPRPARGQWRFWRRG